MEIIELNYKNPVNGKMIIVRAMPKDGKHYIQLPAIKGQNSETVIVVDGDSWNLLHNETGVDLEKLHAEIEDLKEQFYYVLNIQKTMKEVRRKRLEVRLKKLGYPSIESALTPLKDHCIYCDLNEVCKELEEYEDYIEIEGFSRREEIKRGNFTEHNIVYSIPTPQAKVRMVAIVQAISDDIKAENEVMRQKEEMLDRKKSFLEGTPRIVRASEYSMSFPEIMSMPEREWEYYSAYITRECKEYWPREEAGRRLNPFEVMPEDSLKYPQTKPIWKVQLHNSVWNRYKEGISRIVKLYLGLNADLLPEKMLKEVEDLTYVYGEENEEYRAGEELRFLISGLIDSSAFTLASNIEDIAVCARNADFVRIIDGFLAENGDVFTGGMRTSIDELREDSTVQITERMRHVAMFHNAQIKLQQLRKPASAPAPDFEDGIR